MLNQIIIRGAEKSDLRAIYKIEVECFPKNAYQIHYITRFLKDPRFITMVAILGGRIVGYAAAFLEDSEGGWASHICSIAVKPEYRRRGLDHAY